jgi:hypothetical protein
MLLVGVVALLICWNSPPAIRNWLMGILLASALLIAVGAYGPVPSDWSLLDRIIGMSIGGAIGYAGRWWNKNKLGLDIEL